MELHNYNIRKDPDRNNIHNINLYGMGGLCVCVCVCSFMCVILQLYFITKWFGGYIIIDFKNLIFFYYLKNYKNVIQVIRKLV